MTISTQIAMDFEAKMDTVATISAKIGGGEIGQWLAQGLAEFAPSVKLAPKKPKRLTKAQKLSIIENLPNNSDTHSRNQAMLALVLLEKVPFRAVGKIRLEDVNLAEGQIRLSGHSRFIQMQSETTRYLAQYLEDRAFLKPVYEQFFVADFNGRHVSYRCVWHLINRAMSGLKNSTK